MLKAVLASRMPWARATQIAASIGQGLAFVFGFIGLFYNPLLIFIAIFVYLAAAAEAQDAQVRGATASVLVGDVMITEFATLQRSANIDEVIERLLATTQREFPVVDSAGHLDGLLTRDDMIGALKERVPTLRSSALCARTYRNAYRQCLEDSLRLIRQANAPAPSGSCMEYTSHERQLSKAA